MNPSGAATPDIWQIIVEGIRGITAFPPNGELRERQCRAPYFPRWSRNGIETSNVPEI